VETAGGERNKNEQRWEEKLSKYSGTSEKVSTRGGARLQRVFYFFSPSE